MVFTPTLLPLTYAVTVFCSCTTTKPIRYHVLEAREPKKGPSGVMPMPLPALTTRSGPKTKISPSVLIRGRSFAADACGYRTSNRIVYSLARDPPPLGPARSEERRVGKE